MQLIDHFIGRIHQKAQFIFVAIHLMYGIRVIQAIGIFAGKGIRSFKFR